MKRLALALVAVLWSQTASAGGEPALDGAASELAPDGAPDGTADGTADGATDGSAADGTADSGSAPTPPEDEGCSCRVADAPIPRSWPAWLLGLSLALLRRQRQP